MIRTLSATLVAAGLLVSGAVSASGYGYDRDDGRYEWAEVLRVDPIISTYERPVHENQCYQQPVVYREPVRYHGGHRDRTPALLGAIVGGVVGSQFGSGSGRDAATAAGAILGYSAVRDDQRRYGATHVSGGRQYTRYEDRCTTRTRYVLEETVSGYDVTYRHLGKTYRTTTDYHPGDRIRVEVAVRPVR